MLLHYLMKCRSRGLAVYNNEFILGSACVGSEKHSRPQNHWKSVTYLTIVVLILKPHIDELKWCINSKWAALGDVHVTERAVGEWRQRPLLAFVLEGISSTSCNEEWCDVTHMTFWETVIANCINRYSVNHFWADACGIEYEFIVVNGQTMTSAFHKVV